MTKDASEGRSETGVPEVTAAMIDAALEFSKQSSYLSHPKVRHFRGTENGDSIEAWNRDCVAELCRAILAASGGRSATVKPQGAPENIVEIVREEIAETFRDLPDDGRDIHPAFGPLAEKLSRWVKMLRDTPSARGEPDGYAALGKDGFFVGIWRDQGTAELVAAKHPKCEVVPMFRRAEYVHSTGSTDGNANS